MDPLKLLKTAFGRWQPTNRVDECVIKDVTESEVMNMIKNLKNSHSFGHSEIDAVTLKIGAKTLARPISFVTKSLPWDWDLSQQMEIGANRTHPKIDGRGQIWS